MTFIVGYHTFRQHPQSYTEMRQAFNAKEVAEKLGMSERTVSRHVDQGKLRAAKPGKSYIITRDALVEYLGGDEKMVERLFGAESGNE